MRTVLILLFFLFFISCDQNESKSSKDQQNYKIIKTHDTIIDGVLYKKEYMHIYDADGNLLREGYYIKNKPIGKHLYYQDSGLYLERHFKMYDKNINLLFRQSHFFSDNFEETLVAESSILNKELFFSRQRDTLYEKSMLIDIQAPEYIEFDDTFKVHFSYNIPDMTVLGSEILYFPPGDTTGYYSVLTPGTSASIFYKPFKTGLDTIVGIVVLNQIEKESVNDNEDFVQLISFRIPYTVIPNRQSFK